MRLLLLHGFLGAPTTWDRVAPGVAAAVLPGHGPTPDTSPRSFDEAVETIAATLAEPVVVAGYSMGARLALGLALAHPERVRAVVLAGVNPGIDESDRVARIAWEDAQAATIDSHGLSAFVDGWERLSLFATQRTLSEGIRNAERARRLSHTAGGAAWAMRTLGLGRQPSLWDALASSSVPMTFLAGARDHKFAEIAYRASQVAPRSTLHMIPEAGHNLALEAPVEFAAAIAAHEALSYEETNA